MHDFLVDAWRVFTAKRFTTKPQNHRWRGGLTPGLWWHSPIGSYNIFVNFLWVPVEKRGLFTVAFHGKGWAPLSVVGHCNTLDEAKECAVKHYLTNRPSLGAIKAAAEYYDGSTL